MQEEVLVIALGGNALQAKGEAPTIENQIKNVNIATKSIASLVKKGYKVVITHGNGPQVGRLLIQNEKADSQETPAFPFDVCGAMSQALIGYHIQQSLQNNLNSLEIEANVATVVTQVKVDATDPGFKDLNKPIGPFYTKEDAELIEKEKGYMIKEDAGRGYRRVVASPIPKEIIELHNIKSLLKDNNIVICCGGGGVPVVEEKGLLHGVDAVIDKDRASSLLAQNLKADQLIILTDVSEAYINYGKENEQALKKITYEQLKEHIDNGQFAKGSMLPKVQSVVEFVEKTNKKARITSLDKLEYSLDTNDIGTIVINK